MSGCLSALDKIINWQVRIKVFIILPFYHIAWAMMTKVQLLPAEVLKASFTTFSTCLAVSSLNVLISCLANLAFNEYYDELFDKVMSAEQKGEPPVPTDRRLLFLSKYGRAVTLTSLLLPAYVWYSVSAGLVFYKSWKALIQEDYFLLVLGSFSVFSMWSVFTLDMILLWPCCKCVTCMGVERPRPVMRQRRAQPPRPATIAMPLPVRKPPEPQPQQEDPDAITEAPPIAEEAV